MVTQNDLDNATKCIETAFKDEISVLKRKQTVSDNMIHEQRDIINSLFYRVLCLENEKNYYKDVKNNVHRACLQRDAPPYVAPEPPVDNLAQEREDLDRAQRRAQRKKIAAARKRGAKVTEDLLAAVTRAEVTTTSANIAAARAENAAVVADASAARADNAAAVADVAATRAENAAVVADDAATRAENAGASVERIETATTRAVDLVRAVDIRLQSVSRVLGSSPSVSGTSPGGTSASASEVCRRLFPPSSTSMQGSQTSAASAVSPRRTSPRLKEKAQGSSLEKTPDKKSPSKRQFEDGGGSSGKSPKTPRR